jgi:hypothetical protein
MNRRQMRVIGDQLFLDLNGMVKKKTVGAPKIPISIPAYDNQLTV